LPVFSAEDGDIAIYDAYGIAPELGSLLEQPLTWNLRMKAPSVLILHTHATESYTKTDENYRESSAYRTLDENYNMLSIGSRVAEVLSQNGIAVIHDRELHDYPSYDGSYNHARESILFYLEKYPTLELVLDLHRDASGNLQEQRRTVVQMEGREYAQLMLVLGTDAAGLSHPNWQENLALGLKLQAVLEGLVPGITRPLNLRSQRFNQDLSSGALLVEVGTAGNSHAEALLAAEILAEAVIALAGGTETG
jgi:stage II sporulation protein P